jgi:hypothetical protein
MIELDIFEVFNHCKILCNTLLLECFYLLYVFYSNLSHVYCC